MLGFSLVSFIEILYWLTGRLARNCLGKSSDSDEGLTVAELGNARKVRKAEVGVGKSIGGIALGDHWFGCQVLHSTSTEQPLQWRGRY